MVLIWLNLRVVLVVISFVIENFYGEKNLVTKIEVWVVVGEWEVVELGRRGRGRRTPARSSA